MISRGKKILLVEDEYVIAMDLQASLHLHGYDVIDHVTKGEDVISLLEKQRPDIILMDVKLEGEIDGVETAQMVYENYDIPVIFITSYSNKTIIERAKKTNPFGYIVKPFEERELATNIELALYKHESEKKLKESEKKYRELSESIQQIIIEINSNGDICYLNEPGMQILGLRFPEINCKISISKFVGEKGFGKIKNRISRKDDINSQNESREHLLINKFGKHLFIDEYLSPIYSNNEIVGYRGILIDITSKKLKETLNFLYNKVTLLYDELNAEPFQIIKFLLTEFKKHFFYIEDIYFNENDVVFQQIVRHSDSATLSRKWGNGHTEFVIESKCSLYLRGKELEEFNKTRRIQIFGKKAVCWCGFPINFQNKNFGVFAFQSFKNENALTTSDFDNLSLFFNNINSLLERISYLREIQKSEEKYKRLVNSINEGVIQIDTNTKISFINKKLCEITGYTEDELLGMNLFQAFGLNSNSTTLIKREFINNKKGFVNQYEMQLVTKTKKVKHLLINSSMFSDDQGNVIGFVATIIDITEKREILKLVEESEQKFKAIFEQVAVGVAMVQSSSGEIINVNKKYCDIVGYNCSELSIMTFMQFTHPEDLELDLLYMKKLLYGEISEFTIEKRMFKKNGDVVWINLTVSPLWNKGEEPTNHIAIIEDITQRKITEEGLLKSEQEKENILKAMPDSFLVVSKKYQVLNFHCNSTESNLKKIDHENISGYYLDEVLTDNVLSTVKQKVQKCFNENKLIHFEIDYKKHSERVYVEIRCVKINDENVLMILRNVTSMRNNLSELQKFYNITEQSKELIMITDKDGVIEYVNPSFLDLLGYKLEEMVGKKPSILKSERQAKGFYDELWSRILNGETFKCRMVNAKKNKELYIEEKTIAPLRDSKGNITHFISTGKDITEELKRERKIKIYQKFEKTLEKKEQKYRTLSLIQGQENERKRIARELHDGLGQMLTVASANLDSINLGNVKNKEDKAKIEIVTEMVNEIVQESRRISYNLSPVGLYEFGLEAVLKQLVKRINANIESIKIKYKSNLKKYRFSSDTEINLYRIVQEAIQNSLKHANASEIVVEINYLNDLLHLIVSDNGIGFDLKQINGLNKHINGIKNIEERAKIIDAKLNFKSEKSKGFRMELSMKVKIKSHDKNIFS